MLRVFTDFHHAGLLNSLIMLFEDRLGGEVYRPIGMDWAINGFWRVYDHPATQEQFLGVNGATPDGSLQLNKLEGLSVGSNAPYTYHCRDIDSNRTNKAIAFDDFLSNHFDFVIASIPQHIEPFRKLCNLHPDHPKLIYQIGNQWNLDVEKASLLDGVMSSARVPLATSLNGYNGKPLLYVQYHQEFSLKDFRPTDTMPGKIISSFVNCFSLDGMFAMDWAIFQAVETQMLDWSFYALGGQCRDGAAHGSAEVAYKMRQSRFVWHTKTGGDGYGHILHNAAACGRPIITRLSDYRGKLGEDLLIPDVTCINIDGLGVSEIKEKIEWFSEPERYTNMCGSMYGTFKRVVDFDKEEQLIRGFLENIK